ncbi:MAG: 1-deoxy-D-xylulose-5-phosphate synthase, partial [Thermodesulfovibrionia bacterium]|nr:1-deoxy-D-xylulose-5-phosphate synthase [Thermodesulfovibrionia bacterium]
HDVCIQNLPVVFAIDRAGIVGEDGPTHNGAFDISYLRHIPNMIIMAPKDENELGNMLKTALYHNGPVAIRYPRGAASKIPDDTELKEINIGESEILRDGKDILIVALGSTVQSVLKAAELLEEAGIRACVINARFAKPIDTVLIGNLAKEIRCVLTVEENAVIGGFGSGVLEHLSEMNIKDLKIKRLGIPDRFIEHGPQKLLRKMLGLDTEEIVKHALNLVETVRPYTKIKSRL